MPLTDLDFQYKFAIENPYRVRPFFLVFTDLDFQHKFVIDNSYLVRPFLLALTDLDFRHKFVIDNPETPRILAFYKSGMWWFDHKFMIENSWSVNHHGLASRIVFSKTMRHLSMVHSAYYTNSLQKIEYPRWFKQRLSASRLFAWLLLRRQSIKNSKPWSGKDFQMLGSQVWYSSRDQWKDLETYSGSRKDSIVARSGCREDARDRRFFCK